MKCTSDIVCSILEQYPQYKIISNNSENFLLRWNEQKNTDNNNKKKSKTEGKKRKTRKGKYTAYMAFLKDNTVDTDIKAKHPDIDFGDLSKTKSEIWKSMSKDDKDIYQTKANELTSS